MLLATSPQGEQQNPTQAAKACFSIVPWVLQPGLGPPSPAAACLKAGNKTQLRAFSLVEKGSGKGDPCFSHQVSLKLEWTHLLPE